MRTNAFVCVGSTESEDQFPSRRTCRARLRVAGSTAHPTPTGRPACRPLLAGAGGGGGGCPIHRASAATGMTLAAFRREGGQSPLDRRSLRLLIRPRPPPCLHSSAVVPVVRVAEEQCIRARLFRVRVGGVAHFWVMSSLRTGIRRLVTRMQTRGPGWRGMDWPAACLAMLLLSIEQSLRHKCPGQRT